MRPLERIELVRQLYYNSRYAVNEIEEILALYESGKLNLHFIVEFQGEIASEKIEAPHSWLTSAMPISAGEFIAFARQELIRHKARIELYERIFLALEETLEKQWLPDGNLRS